MFHHICQKLPEYTQQCIASFFKELLDTEPITKEALRHAIAEVANTQSPPPRLNDSFSVMGISGGQSATMFSRCESPLKTPKRSAGPHRVSPSTPKSNLLEERTREVYNLRVSFFICFVLMIGQQSASCLLMFICSLFLYILGPT